MSADIFIFPVVRIEHDPDSPNLGNGARSALIEVALSLPNTDGTGAASWSDWLLAELWTRGFMIVPLDGSE